MSLSMALFLTIALSTILVFIAWYKRNVPITLAMIAILALIIEFEIERGLREEIKQKDQFTLVQKMSSIGAKLKGNLQTNLSLLTGFSAYISAEPDLSYIDFSNYAREVFKKDTMLINFTAAKDLVVNYVYPLAGNEKVVGLNYRENPEQREMVMQTVNTAQLQVVGPINLIQGGVAFIGRVPIYTGEGATRSLWGIISAPLSAELLYRQSGILQVDQGVRLALRSVDSLGNKGPAFLGDQAIYDDVNAYQYDIEVGGGVWQLAGVTVRSSTAIPTNIFLLRVVSVVATLLFFAFVLFRFRQVYERASLEATILNNQQLLENVGSVAKIGGWKVDENLHFIRWSEQASLLLSYASVYVPDRLSDLADRFSSDDYSLLQRSIKRAFSEGKPFEIELKLKPLSGENIWLRMIASPSMKDFDDFSVTGTMQDISDQVKSARLIEHQATYDSLTDLPNRNLFNERLNLSILDAYEKSYKIAVLFIDLDRFKSVNDNHGHLVGDRLLMDAARRIQGGVREGDVVARISGDEFGVILSNIERYEDVLKVTENILVEMDSAFIIGSISVYCSASVGIALYPDDGYDAESLIRKSDQAMYEVKDSGRNGWQFYTKEMQVKSEHRHALLNDLIVAINRKELTAYYQPIVNLSNGQPQKCETLARWPRGGGIFVPPDEFIALAEETGLINKIDLQMLERSAAVLLSVNGDDEGIGLTINVSPRLFHTKDRALEKWLASIEKLSSQLQITVEITERLLTDDSDKALDVLQKLKSYGVKIAIDDFGTGYSSLSYLIKFPVDIIKIDRTFISEIGVYKSAETLIETVLLMAKRLGLEVVAEGIETQKQLDFLIDNQCDYGQGYFLAKPMNAVDFAAFSNTCEYS
ncbi:hypothetical protein A9Q99_10340 [Gammaproteobacteria bacterium 45_16_T64]|nr:hypothetical protein A9Q99_10340 [Gammaproteobacteria bacterium 45_16_T64]